MSNQHVGINAESVIKQRPLQPISRVTVICGTDDSGAEIVRTAGDDTGREFTVSLPLLAGDPATAQTVADDLLADVGGYVYQPFEARGALLDPLSRMGDAIFVGDVYSVLASRTIELGVLSPSDIAAPAQRAEDHEFPYSAQPERTVNRRLAQAEAGIRINEGEIALRVKDATGLGATMTLTSAGVAFENSSGGVVTINGGTLEAGTVKASFVDVGIEITAPAITGGTITGNDIYGGRFWDLGQQAYLKMIPYSTVDGYKLDFCTPGHDENDPIFWIATNDLGRNPPYAERVGFAVEQDTFLNAYKAASGDPIVQIRSSDFRVIGSTTLAGEIYLDSDSYGSTLPTATPEDEGRLFFLAF